MTDAVHFLPVSFGYQHYVRPLVQGGFPTDDTAEAVVLVPTGTRWARQVDGAKDYLENEVGLTVSESEVDTSSFAAMVATGYDDIRSRLDQDGEVYVNTASSPWALGHAYATAASYLVAETPLDDTDEAIDITRDQVTLYHTEPDEFRVDELLSVARQTPALRRTFDELRADAGDLRSDVATDRQTAAAIVELLDARDDGSLEALVTQFDPQLEQLGMGDIGAGMHDIARGVELVADGINTLAETENQAALDMLGTLGGGGGLGHIVEGFQSLRERPETETSEVSVVDLFAYIDERLERVHSVLESVERRYEDHEATFERSPDETDEFLDDVATVGIARGARSLDGEPPGELHEELPGPLQFGLRPAQRAILYTLAEGGSAESIQGLVIRVVAQALAVADATGMAIPSDPAVESLEQGEIEPDHPLVAEHLFPKIKSKIQYEIEELVDDGFVEKVDTFGRTVGVALTQAGTAYTTARDFDYQWRVESFDGLCSNIEDALSEYSG